MVKKWFAGLFLVFLCLSFSSAQNTKKQREASSWEYLEISIIDRSCGSPSYPCRRYYYFNSGTRLNGPVALEWLNGAGWELANVTSNEGSLNGLLFRRAFDRERTEKETQWLSEELAKEIQKRETTPIKDLVDLDETEAKQKLIDFNRAEETRLRAALERFKTVPLKILTVSSKAETVGRSSVGAEIVIDGTSTLLKNGNLYRSSEANKFYKETMQQLLESAGLFVASGSSYSLEGNAPGISKGGFKPQLGNFIVNRNGVVLKVSVFVNYRNNQIIVAQSWVYSRWLTDSP